MSPVKTSRKNPDIKYFSGKISDGKKVARMISFHPPLRPTLDDSRKQQSTIAMVNCKIQESKFEPGLEVTASSRTKIESSPKKFKLDDSLASIGTSNEKVTLDEIAGLQVNQLITTVCKVVRVSDINDVKSATGSNLKKQDCIVSDHTDTARVVLWEDHCGELDEGKSYCLEQFRVREYACIKYLSMSGSACINELEDIGEVTNSSGDQELSRVIKLPKVK